MLYEIVVKKRFENKLVQLIKYLIIEWNETVAKKVVAKFNRKMLMLSKQPFIGTPCATKDVRSISLSRHNRIYYRIKQSRIEIINMYDTRINPKRNRYL